MKLSDFDFHLPEELIAQEPIDKRDKSRLLLLDRDRKDLNDEVFERLPLYLKKGDTLVLNNTRVIPARLFGKKESGAKIEFLLADKIKMSNNRAEFKVLAKPSRRLKPGDRVLFSDTLSCKVLSKDEETVHVLFEFDGDFFEILENLGHLPLPKYIKKELKNKDRYQTVYASKGESVAAPTAGLHFTKELLEEISNKGVEILSINLNVGLGTFAPIRVENIEEHKMHSESFSISETCAKRINLAKREGRRIIAVGTTVVRALESAYDREEKILKHGNFDTDIFIKPGFVFNVTDALITNFHLPKSSLIILVSAFAGREYILKAYEHAIDKGYRFFSFGDAMFIR